MTPLRVLSLVSTLALVATASSFLVGGCSQDPTPSSDGPLGATRAGATLATPGFIESTVFSGLTNPTVVRFASDGRAFVAEKNGRIWVYDDLDDTTPTLFANLQARVHDFWDRGLLGLALDPAFPDKPDVYVLYTYDGDPGGAAPKWGDGCPSPPGATGDGCIVSGRLSRFAAVGNVAGAETVLIEGWRQQYPSHATGQIEFGPDGALYASGGDGASFNFVDYGQDGSPINPLGDPPVAVGEAQTPPDAEGGALRSQSVGRASGPVLLNGTVIRVDPETGLGKADNPLAASSDVNAQRVLAYGLRNPFRIAARPGKAELWVADVGWNEWEELNRISLGSSMAQNFGWPCYEGAGRQPGYDAVDLTRCENLYSAGSATPPHFAYRHSARVSANDECRPGSSSLTGIAFYEGGSYPAEYEGALFFSDYSRRCIYVMHPDADSGELDPATARSFHVSADDPVFLTTGPGGDIFYAALGSGTIRRIRYLQPVAAFTAVPAQGQVPLIVKFDAESSVKPLPEDVLTFEWDLDGDGAFDDSSDEKPAFLYDVVQSHSVRLRVTDQRGTSHTSAPLVIKATQEPPPTSTPPVVVIDTPTGGFRWKAGDTIEFSGHATDAEDGELPPSALTWHIVIQHCPAGCHVHELLTFEGVEGGSFPAEDHDYPMHLELILTATDSSGQKRTARRRLDPTTVSLVFDTDPSGLSLVVGPKEEPTPFARRVIYGSENTIAAPEAQIIDGVTWHFESWSDGRARAHTLSNVSTAQRYVARYVPGGGLTGQYFDELAFAGASLTRIDPSIDFDWLDGSPAASMAADTFSVRWTGQVKADVADNYTFSTLSDDGVRVLIDGTPLIDHFIDHAPTVDQGVVALTAGWHDLKVEYYERGGGAQMQLSWSRPSVATAIIPSTHLRPGCNDGGTCAGNLSCKATGECVPTCDSDACTAAERCGLTASECLTLCSGLECPTGDVCVSGSCVDACTIKTCPTGQHCEGGECVADPPPGGEGGAAGHGGDGSSGGEGGGSIIGGGGGGEGGTTVVGTGGDGEGGTSPAGHGGTAGGGTTFGGDGGSFTQGGTALAGSGGAGDGEAGAGGGSTPVNEGGGGGDGVATAGAEGIGGGGAVSGGAPGAGVGGEPGSAEVGGDGGAMNQGSVGAGEGGERDGPGRTPNDEGCSCRTVGTAGRGPGAPLLALAVVLALGRRRRRS